MESSIHSTPRPRTRNLRKHVPEIYPAFNRDVLQQPGLQPPPGNKLGILSLQLLRPPCQQSESVQEGTEDLSPKIKTLQANSEIIQQFHNAEDLHSISLIQPLIQNIMRSLPLEVRLIFTNQFMEFRRQYPANVRPPACTFLFLAQFVNKLEKSYWLNPSLFNLNYSLAKREIEPLRYGHPTAMKKNLHVLPLGLLLNSNSQIPVTGSTKHSEFLNS